jgi:hypothetical protein
MGEETAGLLSSMISFQEILERGFEDLFTRFLFFLNPETDLTLLGAPLTLCPRRVGIPLQCDKDGLPVPEKCY